MIYAFRCKECSLLRVTVEGQACEECLTRMADDEDNASTENDFAEMSPLAIRSGFLRWPPGIHLDAGTGGLIFSAPCTVCFIEADAGADGDISIYDNDSTIITIKTTEVYRTIMKGGEHHILSYSCCVLTKGLYVIIHKGSFRLGFYDSNTKVYAVPYK